MRVAIYARKSAEQGHVTDELKSVRRQVEHGRAYAARKGWTADEAHIYLDDGPGRGVCSAAGSPSKISIPPRRVPDHQAAIRARPDAARWRQPT